MNKIILTISFLILFCSQGYTQRYKRNFKYRQIGPTSIAKTTSDSGKWTANGLGWIESLAVFEKNPLIIYAGSNSGGLYKSIDGGIYWNFVFDLPLVTGALCIYLDQNNPNSLWVGSGTPVNQYPFGLGILYSSDGGKNWLQTGLTFKPEDQKVIWDIQADKSGPSSYKIALGNDEIYFTKDNFKTYKLVWENKSDMRADFRQLLNNRNSGRNMAAGNRLMLSDSNLSDWVDVTSRLSFNSLSGRKSTPPDRFAMAQDPRNDNVVLALYKYGYKNFIDRSEDFGKSWTNIYSGRDFNRVDRNHAEITFDPSDSTRVFVGSVRMYSSSNSAKTFKLISRPVHQSDNWMHDDIRALYITENGDIYTGNDGGVAVSTDHGRTWKDISGEGLAVSQVYGLSASPHKKREILIGCQDLSSFYYTGKEWLNLGTLYGDGGQCILTDSIKLVMQNGRIQQANENLYKWRMVQMPFRADRLNYPIKLSNDGKSLYACDHYLWRKEKRWKNISKDLGKHDTKIQAFDLHEGRYENTFLLAKDQPTWATGEGLKGRLFIGREKDNQVSWEDITKNLGILAWRSISDVIIDQDNPDRIWVCLYGYDEQFREKVYESKDGGKTWKNISDGLPNLNTFSISQISESSGALLLGTEGGLYFRNDKLNTWVQLKGDMPNIIVRDICVQRSHKRVYLGTYGSGVWELKLNRYLRK